LGYTPNAIARGLKTKRTYTLGILIPDITNPFFAEIARGVEDTANVNGFNIILCNTDDKLKKERIYLEILKGRRVDGLILGTAHIKDKSILELENKKFPYILVSRNIEGLDKNCIIVDDVEGGIIATEYLIKLGHRQIAHITGPLKTRSALNRLKGYKLALKKYKIKYQEELVEEEDFSVVGFNDIKLASFVYPALTTIRQPMLEMGELAVKMLLRIIEEGEFNQRKEVLESKLIIRESCKKINRKQKK